MIKLFTILFFLNAVSVYGQKSYSKNYYSNNTIKSEGWIHNNQKNNFWVYYFENGFKKEEGHYTNNQKTKWWIYYDENQQILKKCEYKNDVLNGLTLIYKNNKIVLAEKYSHGQKIKSWNSLSDFKKDNE